MDAFVPHWYEFKNAVVVEIGFLHSQQLTNFFITVDSVTSQVLPFVASYSYPYQVLSPIEKQNA
jgi:hypothetical protein